MLTTRLHEYIQNYDSAEANFNLGREYELIGQTGAAISFYLRTAERSQTDLLQYEALLRMALCFERQRTRDDTEKVVLQKAISLLPSRPEAYFVLSRLYETNKAWQDAYTVASIGLNFCDFDLEPLTTDVQYPGQYGLLFEKGVAAWWVGQTEQSRQIMHDLKFSYSMSEMFANAVNRNLDSIGWPNTASPYKPDLRTQARVQFPGLDTVEKNYSQSYQDLFVLSATNGKRNGCYLEIGSSYPFKYNNTALLETEFGWTGVSIDIDQTMVTDFKNNRNNLVFCLDAMQVDYAKFLPTLGFAGNFDYLQIDCDPPAISFEILKRIPFDQHKFAAVTFEHDYYVDPTIRDQAREYLRSKGYVLVAGNVAYNQTCSYEDWWIHPDLVSTQILTQLIDESDGLKFAGDYLFPDSTVVQKTQTPVVNHTRTVSRTTSELILDQFDWGNNSQEHIDIIKKEVFVDGEYELYNQVKKNNIVVDIGANAGAFTYSILDRQPLQVYCLEPSDGLIDTLRKNTQGHPVTIINRAIGNAVSDTVDTKNFYVYGHSNNTIKTITFQQFVQDYNIKQIDFLKFDCEGGEFEIFTEDNYDFIIKNIRYGVGEWHFSGFNNPVERFIQFRDLYLKNVSRFKVFERSGKEVTDIIFDDSAVQAFFDWWNPDMMAQYIVHFWNDPIKTDVDNSSVPWTVNDNSMPGFWVVDNFYLDPDAVRAFALEQEYNQGGLGKGYIGCRTREQFLFPGLKKQFEQIMGQPITRWEQHAMNGCFQYNSEGEPLVYHCDDQKWAAMLYLTPNAPYETGTRTHALKGTDIRHRDHPEIMRCFRPGSQNLDGTLFEPVDVIGNVYNRLVIFNAGYLHSACGYFGWTQENSRLWQMFFFD